MWQTGKTPCRLSDTRGAEIDWWRNPRDTEQMNQV